MCTPDNQDFTAWLAAARNAGDGGRHDLLERYRNYLLLLASIGADRKLRAKIGDSDVVQETLIQANHDFDQFRGVSEQELTRWMRTIMSAKQARLARQYYGTAARDPRLEQQLQSDIDQSSRQLDRAFIADGTSPSQHAARRERAVMLADALAALPDHYREVVVRHHVQGHTLPEVAQAMGRSVASVKKLWARAMVQLRSSMKGWRDV